MNSITTDDSMRIYPQCSVVYSEEDKEYVCTSKDHPYLSWLAATPEEALHGYLFMLDTWND